MKSTVFGWNREQYAVAVARFRRFNGHGLPATLEGLELLRDWYLQRGYVDPCTVQIEEVAPDLDMPWAAKAFYSASLGE